MLKPADTIVTHNTTRISAATTGSARPEPASPTLMGRMSVMSARPSDVARERKKLASSWFIPVSASTIAAPPPNPEQ